ncbi:hypothetical protein VR41_07395 [Streptomyces sp. NRRL B-1568]|uniref:Acyl carrier protein n=1 Tax=Streptomyces olivoverticillatus TaxID=66427 RepID=A0A7W7PKF8_9ACTN|nr:acyl carrier protein [Streptomyces olivoverticillatus]KJY42522.1 hypothetical protein VR41_07395 [Streptomyces sp. NRRL B-1568]MBB4894216.1 acyl carrier protein [Streptomyces olivoverticillatus]
MQPETETAARENLSAVLTPEIAPEELDLDLDMVEAYGLTSLNKVLFLTSVCEETGVNLGHFTEHDLAAMRTLRDVAEALSRYTNEAV